MSTHHHYPDTLFVRLGRSVWFTLESVHRARTKSSWDNDYLASKVATAAAGGASQVVKDWESRGTWTDDEWKTFLQSYWLEFSTTLFKDDFDSFLQEEEKDLITAFTMYFNLYCSSLADPTGGAETTTTSTTTTAKTNSNSSSTTTTLQSLATNVDRALGLFYARLGDSAQTCEVCHKCALGYKPKRCSRCKQNYYCSPECQRQHWKESHKKQCVPPSPSVLTKLVQQRYKVYRRHGKNTKEAMNMARADYDIQDNDNDNDTAAGKQVAAMFGLSAIM